MKKTRTRKVITETITETWKLDDGVNLRVVYINGKINHCDLLVNKKLASYVKDGEAAREYFRNHAFHEFDEKNRNYLWDDFLVEDGDLFNHITENGYDSNNVLFFDTSSHNVKDINGKYLDSILKSDYIGGFKQPSEDGESCGHKWDWEKLKEHLKNHPNVKKFEIEKIPYYNCDFYDQEGLCLDILIPEEWRDYGDLGWDLKGVIISWRDDWKDPLGIKQFIKE